MTVCTLMRFRQGLYKQTYQAGTAYEHEQYLSK